MKITVEELTKGISKFLENFLFELLDSTTIECLESQLGNILRSKYVGITDYKLRSTILDKSTLKINLKFDKHNIDFYLAEASYE